MMKTQTKTILATALLGIAWAVAIAFGIRFLLNYETRPGHVGTVPGSWPAHSTVQLATDRLTLVMIAHPECPCTRASVAELAEVMARTQGKISAYVLFYLPTKRDASWADTELRNNAAQIPGVTVLSDLDGVEAGRFGAETSGHTFVYDAAGKLLFNGGITASRGHSGDNDGESTVVSLAHNQAATRSQTFVFGCSIRNQSQQGAKCLR